MGWQSIYQKSCTFCAQNVTEGYPQCCASYCPTKALARGDDDPESANCQEVRRCQDLRYHL